jgi:inositol phosphorylceramide mannosyltransferase catalytic subunit
LAQPASRTIDGPDRICSRSSVVAVAPSPIPRIFHRTWFGGPMPRELAEYGDTFLRHHPGWRFALWSERNLPRLRNQHLFDSAPSPAHKSDIARYEILYELGGIYVDADLECLRPFDTLLRDGATCFFVSDAPGEYGTAVLGAAPKHPLFDALVREIPAAAAAPSSEGPGRPAGPAMLTSVLHRRSQHGSDDAMLLPGEAFYAYPWSQHGQARGAPVSDAYVVRHGPASARRPGPNVPPSGGAFPEPAVGAASGSLVVTPGTVGTSGTLTVTSGPAVLTASATGGTLVTLSSGTIPHFWQRLQGSFTFPDFYAWLAEQMPRDRPSRIVEVGVYAGQSAAFLGVELMRCSRPCKIDLVGAFHGGPLALANNLRPITPVRGEIVSGDSAASAARYEDGAVDAVLLDANQDYEGVSKDIDAWRPKVRAGGILAGHDFCPKYPGVVRAVTERFARWEVWRGFEFGPDRYHYPVWQVWV